MELDDIFEQYAADVKVDQLDLGNEALRLSRLYEKYLRLASIESRELRKLESRYKQLYNLKVDWYVGDLNGTEELTKLGWEPTKKLILKSDMTRVVEGDRDIIKLTELLGEQKEKHSVLVLMAKEIKDRSFNIRAAIDMLKFNAGA